MSWKGGASAMSLPLLFFLLALSLGSRSKAWAEPTSNPDEISRSRWWWSPCSELCFTADFVTQKVKHIPNHDSSVITPHGKPAVCRLAVEVQDPVCKNGGYLRAENNTAEPTSCGDCICPPNWEGGDCSCE